ncbi:hypothetical protein M406DRAFT_323246 [Cryphonectria parasitica EP155]|uniref:Uncharacterized protein n=1 Tax=Cryphonectria parasitica (strain ATCC 38755 / EP155) TaxID=660469 RepID=A0A9P4XZC3_CRYP1|nr:uncharacterized protein M406DRAFT_323246 [Cryphonectria parasitica EP155]KAF3763679.1 hypothetical protein M406DRAFT_323246 [Cryphonectria parasitica EP155]
MSSPTKTTPAAVEKTGPQAPLNSGPLNSAPRFGEEPRDSKLVPQVPNHLPMPGLSGHANSSVGNLLKGPVDHEGNLKDASLTVGIKLDLEAEVHLTARVRGDILVGLY